MNTDDNEMFAVLYAGDSPAGTKDTWQLWTKLQLDHANNDGRIIEAHRLINWEQIALKWWKQGMTDAAELCRKLQPNANGKPTQFDCAVVIDSLGKHKSSI